MSSKNIRFSIGAKFITIITIILILSLGSLTFLVSWLVRSDLQVLAEEKNFDLNRRSAAVVESILTNTKANSSVLIYNITAHGSRPAQAAANLIRRSTDFFFAENPQIASVFFDISGMNEQVLINADFFQDKKIDQSLAAAFFKENKNVLVKKERAEVLLNASPHFSRSASSALSAAEVPAHPLLALFFSWNETGIAGVLFSSESLNYDFGIGDNKSWLLNSEGDLLTFYDFSVLKKGANLSDLQFIRSIFESAEKNKYELLEDDFGILKIKSDSVNSGFIQKTWNKAWGKIKKYLKIADASLTDKTKMFTAFTKLNTAGSVVITGIEYDKVFEMITAATWRNIYLTICALCLSIIIVSLFSMSISVPLKSLAAAASQIGEGNFNFERIEHDSDDEIGLLSDNFNKMSSALNIFNSYSNKDIAVKTLRGEIKTEGSSKYVSVLFCDILGFEAITEDFSRFYGAESPEKILLWLNKYFSEAADCVEKTGGVTDKFNGDAITAHWGAASSAGSPRNDAFYCIKAALLMRKSLYYLNKKRRAGDPGNPPVRINCGINSGIVAAGFTGSVTRKEFTVMGDPVNTASRIERQAKENGIDILISEETWKLAGDRFVCEEMPSVTNESRSKPIKTFAVINFAGEQKGPQTISDVRSLLGY